MKCAAGEDKSGRNVDLQKLTQQLKSEAAAHPIKAGVLVLGVAMAVWFWIPLFTKMVSGDKPSSPVTVANDKPKMVAAKSQAATPKSVRSSSSAPSLRNSRSSAQVTWPRLREWMQADSRTLSAEQLANPRDPFEALARPQLNVVADDAGNEAVVTLPQRPLLTADSVGLELTSTLVGRTRSVAMISGKSYRLTRTSTGLRADPAFIKVQGEGRDLHLTLAAVYPTSVILEVEGQRLRLKLVEVDTDAAVTFSAVTPDN